MRKLTSLARGSDSILCPTQENCGLSHVEWSRAVLEHLWNTNVVHRWGRLARDTLDRS